jgi:hypothetical protein
VESDGKRKYFYPQRDGSFAVTATLVEADFIERGSLTVEKSFGAGEDEFVGAAVSYHDVDAGYGKLEQSYDRPIGLYDVTRSKKKRTFNTTLSLTANQAKALATKAVFRSVLGNERYSFGLVPGKSHIEPADILQVDFRGFTAYVRVKEAVLKSDYSQDVLGYQYLQLSDATYTGSTNDDQVSEDEESGDRPRIRSGSLATRFIYLDVPLLSSAHDLGGTGLVQYAMIVGTDWDYRSVHLLKSTDGEYYVTVGGPNHIIPIAGTISAISGTPADPFIKDTTNSITVVITAGEAVDLDTITATQFEAGANLAAIGQPGRWVLLWFQTVSDSGNTATLTNLMWGVRGSEVWIDDLVVGDQFVVLNPEHYIRFSNATSLLDDTIYYKGAHVHAALQGYPVLTHAYAAGGVAETPYAPTNLYAEVSGSDIAISWDYRSRIATGTNPTNHGEASLSFEIDIIDDDGTTVLRTLTATTNSKTYAAANITTDFGSIPAEITFRVYMMSALVGRGYMAQATMTLGRLLLESGDFLLLESGDNFSLE